MTPKQEYDTLARAMDMLARELAKIGDSKLATDIVQMSLCRAELEKTIGDDL